MCLSNRVGFIDPFFLGAPHMYALAGDRIWCCFLYISWRIPVTVDSICFSRPWFTLIFHCFGHLWRQGSKGKWTAPLRIPLLIMCHQIWLNKLYMYIYILYYSFQFLFWKQDGGSTRLNLGSFPNSFCTPGGLVPWHPRIQPPETIIDPLTPPISVGWPSFGAFGNWLWKLPRGSPLLTFPWARWSPDHHDLLIAWLQSS